MPRRSPRSTPGYSVSIGPSKSTCYIAIHIENIITTNDALFQAMASSTGATDPATKEVMRYRGHIAAIRAKRQGDDPILGQERLPP